MNTAALLLMTFLLPFASCNDSKNEPPPQVVVPSSAYPQLENANWLLGVWHHGTDAGDITECWRSVNDSTYAGQTTIVKNHDTVFSEILALECRDSNLYYNVSLSGNQPGKVVAFKLSSSTPEYLVFENPAHDFPTKITYSKIGRDSLFAEISGSVAGIQKKEGFPFKKRAE